MALSLHVSGTIHVKSQTSSSGSLEELGVSEDGVTLTINTQYEDVYTDHYGPKVPYDVQYFLQDVIIEVPLIWYEKNVLYKWLPGMPIYTPFTPVGTPQTLGMGSMGYAGDLAVQNAHTARLNLQPAINNGLALPSIVTGGTSLGGLTVDEDCWNFPNAILIDSKATYGVEKTVLHLKFRALPSQQASASYGATIFNFACV